MNRTYRIASLLLPAGLAVAVAGCIEPFEPQVDNTNVNYLVVDGFINTRGVSTIRLSRTFNLSTGGQPPAEARARVYIEDEGGNRVTLTEVAATPGTYVSPSQQLVPGRKYRLHFFSSANKEYASEYTPAKITPPIDSVGWTLNDEGVVINVSAHDDTNATQHYRWSYDETWEFTSAYASYYELRNGRMRRRTDDIYHCWKSTPGTTIRLSNTTRLSQAVIAKYPLLTILPNNVRLSVKYSILVKQYAQTAEEYAYWDLMRKNTENIGTLFDPLPSQLTGNVHNLSEPEVPVLGYIGAYSVTEKRIFISRSELPTTGRFYDTGYENCSRPDTIMYRDIVGAFASGATLPIDSVERIGFTGAAASCVDCRFKGTNVRPLFWR